MANNKKPRTAESNREPKGSTQSVPEVVSPEGNDHGGNAPGSSWCSHTLVHGWLSIAIWMTFGVLLEGLLGFKTPGYLQDEQRRELFRLAHTHGAFLGLVLIAAALCGQRFKISPPRIAIVAFRIGATVMPIGFLLAGIWHYESDPGLAIWLVPPAAILLVLGSVAFGLASRANSSRDE